MTFYFLHVKKKNKNHVVTSQGNLLTTRGRCGHLSAAGLHCRRLACSGRLTGVQPITVLRESWRPVGGVPSQAPRAAGSGDIGVARELAEGGGRTDECGLRLR